MYQCLERQINVIEHRCCYKDNEQFVAHAKHFPQIIQRGCIRNRQGIVHNDWLLNNRKSISESVVRALPILGNILGAAKLFSIFAAPTKADSKVDIAFHTFAGILETLGLGLVVLALKIMFTVISLLTRLSRKQPEFVQARIYHNLVV
ncbi:hypothetical protein [Chlamydia caviae]|uniref:Uncharacterized protein n=1 Tax=Chlamydia caviae (strain ATCC VR-813 / DSM 19441 / 03DC25 / GPIC) TaxID=227941 RepID=Q823N3_CHLCV|nr:hypothetical protein [Chlamydia caviae]AAP05122.1 conserved hypothetical protein [Chlamydia caviae GPIC]